MRNFKGKIFKIINKDLNYILIRFAFEIEIIMSLDKWIKSDEDKEEKRKGSEISKEKTPSVQKQKEEIKKEPEEKLKLKKYLLKCSNSKCNYQKTLMTRELAERDKICPRCKEKMQVKEI
ncbi:MAG: hypothetical protein BAJALOKI3v1_10083 [Promethearchaeota archaeon]|nr:MAG: hypothetical protein BAJALOKI3v1_10083 [Candidatus Lokiarchaeota archaeon]